MSSDCANEETAQPQAAVLDVNIINAISAFNEKDYSSKMRAVQAQAEINKRVRDAEREDRRREREYDTVLLKRDEEKVEFRNQLSDWVCAATAVIGVVFLAWVLYILGAWLRKISA
ncbi:hypothetical protein B0T25DRAFT_576572 [Lasiosphaeria hispida]|uniref:Uncharacterized protein n=1 Tax=Lasiosphaeria hispida TaxID=260671 RepID=A0AAJ0HX33_9PEZI|nr:hypothetical protein B0T25DRAFT_576572 [Lasiosphaeria hispida]